MSNNSNTNTNTSTTGDAVEEEEMALHNNARPSAATAAESEGRSPIEDGEEVPVRAAPFSPSPQHPGVHIAEDVDETEFGIFDEVYHILKEAYNPNVMAVKAPPTFRIRTLKVAGLIINQKVGQLLLGWNGRENRLFDRVGFETDALFFKLYGHSLREKDVQRFIHRRLHYAFITALSTALQIYFTYHAMIAQAVLVSVATAPVTMLERQWATSVTKNPPRLLRHVVLNKLQWPLVSMINAQQDTAFKSFQTPPRVRQRMSYHLVVGCEMFFGFLQAVCGLLLLVVPALMVFYPEWKHGDMTISIPIFHQEGWTLPTLLFLNYVRVVKELCNWVSPAFEKYLTPHKYDWGDRCLQSFAAALLTLDAKAERALLSKMSGGQDPEIQVCHNAAVLEHHGRLTKDCAQMLEAGRGQLPHYLRDPERVSHDEKERVFALLKGAAEQYNNGTSHVV